MATAFTPEECARITERLKDAALACLPTVGMRHTTVDELAREAGISKGAFYRFFESKEHLFLRMLERMQDEMYGGAERILEMHTELPLPQRARLAICEVFRVAQKHAAISFIRDDVPLIIRRLPQEEVRRHYVSDEERLKRMLAREHVRLKTDPETACTMVRVLLMSLTFKQEIGQAFDDAVRLMIDGLCDRIFE